MLSLVSELEVTTLKTVLEKIQARAEKKWGKRWLANLTHEYVAIAQAQGDEDATFERRRTQIGRVFENQKCTADTLLYLIAAVDCKIQLACMEIEEM